MLMEELANLGGHQGAAARPRPPLPSSSKFSVQVYTVPCSATSGGPTAGGQAVAPAATHASGGHLVSPLLEDGGRAGRLDPLKARIVSHPRYHHLLTAFLDCHKVGCPPETAEEIAAAAWEREARQRAAAADVQAGPDPELDQFMEAYCKQLVEWKEELSRPLREAKEFLRTVESQLNSINTGPPLAALVSAEENIFLGSSDDEQVDGSGMEMEAEDQAFGIDPRSDDKELKRHLLKKYSGYLGSLRKELSKKKKKSKLPKEARQKLLSWWELHYRWPYPSEMEKIALAESTGLEQKQINNWFINQRKRHWKPSEEMQFAVMEAYHHPQNAAAALYVNTRLVGAAAPAAAYDRPGHGMMWHN